MRHWKIVNNPLNSPKKSLTFNSHSLRIYVLIEFFIADFCLKYFFWLIFSSRSFGSCEEDSARENDEKKEA